MSICWRGRRFSGRANKVPSMDLFRRTNVERKRGIVVIKRVMHPTILTIVAVHYSILFAASANDLELNDRMRYLYLISAGLFSVVWGGAISWLYIHRDSDSKGDFDQSRDSMQQLALFSPALIISLVLAGLSSIFRSSEGWVDAISIAYLVSLLVIIPAVLVMIITHFYQVRERSKSSQRS